MNVFGNARIRGSVAEGDNTVEAPRIGGRFTAGPRD